MEWTLERLRQFATVAECGSMTHAARRLGRSQSALSMAMGLLEVDLGVTLFDRSSRALALTSAGQVMLLEARALLDQAQVLDLRARALSEGQPVQLGLALDEALPYAPIARLLRELAERFPALDLTAFYCTATEVARYVGSERALLGFQFDRGAVDSMFAQHYVASVPQVVCVARDHPLASAAQINRQALATQRQLVMHIEGADSQILSPRIWRSDSFYLLADMVAGGVGWAILPRNIAEYADVQMQIAVLDCPELQPPPLAVRMLTLQGAVQGDATRWLRQRMGELLTQVEPASLTN